MGWIAVVFIWFMVTVLRGSRERFAFGMLVTGFLAVAFLNAINPDAVIVQTNVNRAKAEQPLDARYVSSLSADGLSVLIDALSLVPEKERKAVAQNILKRWSGTDGSDWRTWNLGRARAREAVSANEGMLRDLALRK